MEDYGGRVEVYVEAGAACKRIEDIDSTLVAGTTLYSKQPLRSLRYFVYVIVQLHLLR